MFAIKFILSLLMLSTITGAYKLAGKNSSESNQLEIPDMEVVESDQVITTKQQGFKAPKINYEQGFKFSSIFQDAQKELDMASNLKNMNDLAKKVSQEIEEFLAKSK